MRKKNSDTNISISDRKSSDKVRGLQSNLKDLDKKEAQKEKKYQNVLEQLRITRKELLEQMDKNEELEHQLRNANESLVKITSSRAWKLVSKFRYFFNEFFPKGSISRKILGIGFRIFRPIGKIFAVIAYKGIKVMRRTIMLVKSMPSLRSTELFDAEYYQEKARGKRIFFPMLHYLFVGYKKGLSPSVHFDAEYYRFLYANRSMGNPLVDFFNNPDPIKNSVIEFTEYINKNFDSFKETLAFQVDSFDKGGLEEVVLSLATDEMIRSKYNVVILLSTEKVGYMSSLAQKCGIPVLVLKEQENLLNYVIKRLNIKICNLHYSLFGLGVYKNNDVKTVYTVHNNYIWGDSIFIKNRKKGYKLVDFFVAVSSQVGNYFTKTFNIPDKKLKIIPNGVCIDTLKSFIPQKREAYGLKSKDYVFINVSSFSVNKFHPLMVAAMGSIVKKYPSVKLLFVGNIMDEEYFRSIKELIVKYEVEDNIKIINFIPKREVMGLLKIANCFILPSLTEGFSISTIEAMNSGLPLVLSDVGGAREVIKHKDIGIIIKNPYENIFDLNLTRIEKKYRGDRNLTNLLELVSAMENMHLNSKEWEQKAKLGIKKVKNIFNVDRVAQEYYDVFASLNQSRG